MLWFFYRCSANARLSYQVVLLIMNSANVWNKLLLFRNSKEQSLFPELQYNDQIKTYFGATYTPFYSNKTLFINRGNNCLQSSRDHVILHFSQPSLTHQTPTHIKKKKKERERDRRIYQVYLEEYYTPWKLSSLFWQVKSVILTLWQKSHFFVWVQ